MKFSQELVDDTVLPKMDMFNMSMKNKSKLSKEVGEAIIGKLAKPMENGKDSIQEIIISEYEKAQRNIQPVWIGEGWYKSTPNSFNYFASGFEAGMEFSKQQNIGENT